MQIILYRPQIPANTGNIVRTCHATGAELILVKPLGFKIDDKSLKRAGLDYWEGVKVTIIDDLLAYLDKTTFPFYFFSSKGSSSYTDINYSKDSILIFGSESAGIPRVFWGKWSELFLTIPMKEGSRCLNLSNAAAVVLYEALRQNSFSALKKEIKAPTILN